MNEILISIIIVTYNSKNYIKTCIDSILKQNCPDNYDYEIIIVDNCSTDETVSFISNIYPDLKIIINDLNLGYGIGNNLGINYSNGEYIVILNPDTILDEKWLVELIKPLIKTKKLITTPKVLTYDGSMINSCGLITHFTGLGFTRGFKESINKFNNYEYVNGIFGCCFAIRKDEFLDLGCFDENIFLYCEDVELSWKAHLNEYKILYIPKSQLKHDYALNVNFEKIYHLEMGRYLILRKYLSYRDIILISPSLIITEILTWGYALKNGRKGLKYKARSIKEGLFRVEVEKVKSDNYYLFRNLDQYIPVDQLTSNNLEKKIKRIVNKLFRWNGKLLHRH